MAAPRAATRPAPCLDVAISPDGRRVAAARHRDVLLLDASTGKLQATLSGHAGPVTGLAFSPGGSRLAVGGGIPGRSGEIRIWDPAARRLVRTLSGVHTDRIQGIAWSPDGRQLAAGSYDRLVSVWDANTGQGRPWKDHTDAVYAVAFSPDGTRVASVAGDRTLKLWDTATGRRLFTLGDSTAELYAVAFSPDGAGVAAGGVDRSLRIWTLTPTAGSLARSGFAHDGPLLRIRFSPDGSRIVTCAEDRVVKVWNAATLAEERAFPPAADWPLGLALNTQGDRIITGGYEGAVFAFSLTGERLWRFPARPVSRTAVADPGGSR